jgi:uncharacterized protein (TIGR02246 family)
VKRCLVLLAPLLLLGAAPRAHAQEDPAHKELRALKEQILKAYNEGNVDALVSHFTDDAVVTWQNGVVKKTPKEIKAYFDEMSKGADPPVRKATIDPVVDDLTHLYGDTGVAYGSSNDTFLLRDGTQFKQHSRWTATVVKQNGQWKIAALHICVDMFDNPYLDIVTRKIGLYAAAAGAIGGLVIGVVLAMIVGRLRRAS